MSKSLKGTKSHENLKGLDTLLAQALVIENLKRFPCVGEGKKNLHDIKLIKMKSMLWKVVVPGKEQRFQKERMS